MFDIGGGELLLIMLAVLLLFGPKHLPELSRTLGRGWRQLQKAQEDLRQQLRELSTEIAEPDLPRREGQRVHSLSQVPSSPQDGA
ncbi:MAG: twin-arginine translocase TatA/TatE family subunit [Candidatus Kapabacteria bacterium]|nr:twin-arginine translocase TatA/TatE family subunit [Candidatus Kapabacteria bacterium]MCS7169017.1 twin-arginine translocase TatA/TatE family subunit [Candidatus Kapabacteria bacterium]MDW7997122.1 twin-arginine translocase TatA/TatE family subunit [Bacteroidota bacterium]MDW8225763.1 twin-arginine translocase TatA/TatE family subunit [Bacteroidota bacterium]